MIPKTYEAFQIEGASLKATIQVPESVSEYDALGGKEGLCLSSGIDNDWYRGGAALLRYYFYESFEKQITGEFPSIEALKRKVKKTGTKKGKNGEPDEDKYAFAEGEMEYVRRALPVLCEARNTERSREGLAPLEEIKVDEFQSIVDRLLTAYEPAEGIKEEFVFDIERARKTTITDADGNLVEVPVFLLRIDPTEHEQKERGPKTLPKKFAAAGAAVVRDGQGDAFIAHYGIALELPVDADEAKVAALKSEAIGWKIKAMEDAEAAKVNLNEKYKVPSGAQAGQLVA